MRIDEVRRGNLLLLLAKHKKQTVLGQRTDTPAAYFSQVVNRTRNMGGAVARRIEERLQLPEGWMDSPHNEASVAEPSATYAANVEPGPDIRGHYPLISWVQAGRWCEIMDNFSPGDAEEWIPCPVSCGSQTFVLRVMGVSMEPKFREGELVFVDPSRRAENGSFVVVRLEDRQEATFKQLISEGGRQYLKALNPAWPDPIIEVTERATVCGVVVFKGEQL